MPDRRQGTLQKIEGPATTLEMFVKNVFRVTAAAEKHALVGAK